MRVHQYERDNSCGCGAMRLNVLGFVDSDATSGFKKIGIIYCGSAECADKKKKTPIDPADQLKTKTNFFFYLTSTLTRKFSTLVIP